MPGSWKSWNMTAGKVYAIYARQSIDKTDSISIETQIERCLFEVGSAPCRVYSDRGYSGKNTDRPQFQQMLEGVRSGEVCCVICYKLDRCSRSILDFTQLMELFQQHGVAFVSCTEKFDTGTPMGRAMLNICIVFAQLERETIQQRITDAYHSRCKKGYFMGGRIPFGFTLAPYVLEGRKTSRYEAVPEEAEILRQIYEHYKAPGASLSDVVLGLHQLGIRNPRRTDGLWIRPQIARLIKNPIYVMADERIYDHFLRLHAVPDNPREDYTGRNGCYLYRIGAEQHLVLAPHMGIIPSDTWLQCQKTRQISSPAQMNQVPSSWLTGVLTCKKCGRAAAIRKSIGKNGRIYRYMLCAGSRGKARLCAGFRAFPAPSVEEAVWQAITRRLDALSRSDSRAMDPLREILLHIEKQLPDEGGQMEGILQQLTVHLDKRQNSRIPAHLQQWERINTFLAHPEDITEEKKGQIASLLIDAVELTDGRVTVVWRI